MGETTAIPWCDHTFNAWIGCQKVGPECDFCYAEAMMDTRWGKVQWGPHGERKRTSAANWKQVEKWNRQARERFGRRARVFCNSLADVFDNQAPAGARRDLFKLMWETPDLEWLPLTKRPQNIIKMVEVDSPDGWPPNAAMGTTAGTQAMADIGIPALLAAKETLKPLYAFVSVEPLLEEIDLTKLRNSADLGEGHPWLNALGIARARGYGYVYDISDSCTVAGLDWVIVGCESGPKARPMMSRWAKVIRAECAEAGVPFFMKQMMGISKLAEFHMFPRELQVREFPT
jgi:protein gp37